MEDKKEQTWQEKEKEAREKIEADRKIDIVITSYNRRQFTETCIREIYNRTTTPHRVIVVDNGSTDDSVSYLQALKHTGHIDVLILLDRNLGLERAKNIGLSVVNSTWYVDTDNDIIVESPRDGTDWLAKLVDLIARNTEFGGIACRPQVMVGEPGNAFDKVDEVREGNAGAHARIMHTDTIRDVGGWNNHFTNRSEEKEIRGRLGKVQLKTGYAKNIRCIHLFGENWGYKGVEHFHRDIWPPVQSYEWNNVKINWETCRKEDE